MFKRVLWKNEQKQVTNAWKEQSKFQDWLDARKRHNLSHAHIQMARELGLNPKNHKQELWEAPLPMFYEPGGGSSNLFGSAILI
jgi:hypothetical protein